MNCSRFPWLDFFEDDLTAEQRREADQHLESCPDCSRRRDVWQAGIAEAACVAPVTRLGCPDPEALVLAETGDAEPWVLAHLDACDQCAGELAAVCGAEVGVQPVAAPLPEGLAEVLVRGAVPARDLARDVLALVRERLGESPAVLRRWKGALAELLADAAGGGLQAAPSYAALDEAGEGDADRGATPAAPIEVTVRTDDLEVDLVLSGPWLRSRAFRNGVPLRGVSIRVENELGEILETETDTRGEATVREDLPGLRRVVVEARKAPSPRPSPAGGRGGQTPKAGAR